MQCAGTVESHCRRLAVRGLDATRALTTGTVAGRSALRACGSRLAFERGPARIRAMSTAKTALFIALALIGVFYVYTLYAASREQGADVKAPSPLLMLIGFVTNFFDTLGIGSFATTTSIYKLKNL